MARLRLWIMAVILGTGSLVVPATAAAQDVDFADDFDYTPNLQPVGSFAHPNPASGVFNSDLAFWGDMAIQGTYDGFNILDISNPANPTAIVEFDDCVQGTTNGNQGDIVVWGDILVRAWNSPAGTGGRTCGGIATPEGEEGSHVFDISDPANPVGLAFVPTSCGTHTLTAVPDPSNGRLLIYSSASSGAILGQDPDHPDAPISCRGLDILEVPLDDPAAASYLRFEPASEPDADPEDAHACHDTGVILGKALLAACAGGPGVTVWTLDPRQGGSVEDPKFLYTREFEGVTVGHSAAFTWDGRVLVFGHEPGGGGQARCQESSNEVDKTLFFLDSRTGADLGTWVLPRPQTATENCTIHNFNVVPSNKGYLLVSGNYQSGISVVDFTDPANAVEVAYADPEPLSDTQLMIGGDWSSYWYNGHIYESDITRGLQVWRLRGNQIAATARRQPYLNPQTIVTPMPQRAIFDTRPTGSLRLVGHDPLLDRGMNAAIAIHGDYAYIGSRTDGHEENEDTAGIMVVDISDPTDPEVVNRIGPPRTAGQGESSRELRVWESQEILIVLHTNCGGAGAHECVPPSRNNFRFFDISGDNATDPQLIVEHGLATHEFFLWQDPFDPERALMYGGSAGNQLRVWDLSPVLDGEEPDVLFSGGHGFSRVPPFPEPQEIPTGGLHSLSINNDGTRAYYALLTGGFGVADVSDFAAGVEDPERRIVTINENRPTWPGPGTHSAVKLYNRDWVYVSDEVYGSATSSAHGCPWGWARTIDISDPTTPTIEGEYRVKENLPWLCHQHEPRPRTSYSSHNPTLTPNMALTTWHSNGFQMINLEDPTNPYQIAEFLPEPLDEVQTEDPRLSSDPDTGNGEKVVMWSYPIIKDGLIYVVDLRNGLYILEYDGAFEDEVNETTFLEGNSNQGHALCFEHVLMPKDDPGDPDEYYIPDYC